MSKIIKPETNTIIGKPLELGEKILYPVIQISILKNSEGNVKGIWAVPVAFVVEEGLEMFLISLTNGNEPFGMLPSY